MTAARTAVTISLLTLMSACGPASGEPGETESTSGTASDPSDSSGAPTTGDEPALYLADYPLGHLIAFQIEEHIHKAGKLGPEFERMASLGALTPDLWMTQATGAPVAAEPLLRATEAALAGAAAPAP